MSSGRAYVALGGLVALLLVLVLAYRLGAQHTRQAFEAQQAEVQRAVLKRYQQRVKELGERDRELAAVRAKAEVEYGHAMDEVERQRGINERLGRLRDPGRTGQCGGAAVSGTGPAASSADDGAAGRELSAEATRFLLDFARDADRAAVYAETCHRWVMCDDCR